MYIHIVILILVSRKNNTEKYTETLTVIIWELQDMHVFFFIFLCIF